jgi:hypothetical protein
MVALHTGNDDVTRPPRPQALRVIPENIPCDLRERRQWVTWRLEPKKPKKPNPRPKDWTKVPYSPGTDRKASSTDPATWGTFTDALAAYRRGGCDGIGFVLHPASDTSEQFVGIDLDGCRDPETGEVEPWAREIVATLRSYTEASATGTGLRIFLRATLPPGGNRKGNFEVYDRGRYLTVTGHVLEGEPRTIEHRQAELDQVHANVFGSSAPQVLPIRNGAPQRFTDEEIVERASAAANGEKFRRLWHGDTAGYSTPSEADLALCSTLAFWTGPDPARMDALFRQSGLVREKWLNREDYRRRTIAKALAERTEFYASGAVRNGQHHDGKPAQDSACAGSAQFSNFREEASGGDDERLKMVRVGRTLTELSEDLLHRTGGWPKRVGNLLFVPGPNHRPLYLENPHALFAYIGRHHPVIWATGADKVPQVQFHAHLQQEVEDFDAVEPFPHHPPMPRVFYMHPPLQGGDGKTLDKLLKRFHPSEVSQGVDADLVRAAFLSVAWGGPPGLRPAWLMDCEADDVAKGRGVGKTKLAEALGQVVGGVISVSADEGVEKMMPRLLSPAALDRRMVLMDNIKRLRFSSADLEALITADTLSGRRLYQGEGRRPNTLTWMLTLNGASLSRDLAQRCIIVRLARPARDPRWWEDTLALVAGERWALLGDIVAALSAPPAHKLSRHSRWAAWEEQILSRLSDPGNVQKVIEERQAEVDDDTAEALLVRGAICAELRRHGHNPENDRVFITSKEAARLLQEATGEQRPTNRASQYIATLSIPELRKSAHNGERGWAWAGKDSTPDGRMGLL